MSQGHVEVDFENAKLWLRCMDYIEIIKDFICCERLGMWDAHMNAVTALLNLFAATCSLCQVCSPLCPGNAQASVNSSLASPEVCRRISHCTVRRSERLWAGLWTDIVIEQVLMRSLKSQCGLTRGRGMTESVRQQRMHDCAAIHDEMASLTGTQHTTSHQHC